MWHKIENALAPIFNACAGMGREEWVGIFLVALTIGFFCMRGFGSRSKY